MRTGARVMQGGFNSHGVIFFLIAAAWDVKSQQDDDPDRDDSSPEQLSPDRLRGLHQQIDKDQNGKASLFELLDYSANIRKTIASKEGFNIFESIDINGDRMVSMEEALEVVDDSVMDEQEKKEAAMHVEVEIRKFQAADNNGDNLLNIDELPSMLFPEINDAVLAVAAQHRMTQLDQDHDGKLHPREFWQAISEDFTKGEKEDFARFDQDGDGYLNLEEVKMWEAGVFESKQMMNNLLDIADKDGDMHISADELVQARELIVGSPAHYHLVELVEHTEL